MDTADSTDPAKIQIRREKHKARGINGNGFGQSLGEKAMTWAAPRTVAGAYTRDQGDPAKERPTLEGQAGQWMAPNVPNGGRTADHAEVTGRTATHQGKKVQIGLEHQARQWPTPNAADSKTSPDYPHKGGNPTLVMSADRFRPPSSPVPPIRPGPSSCSTHLSFYLRLRATTNSSLRSEMRALLRMAVRSTDGKRRWRKGWAREVRRPYVRPAFRRKLNPLFVEALMRWPTGLSGFARPETAWTRWWHAQLSFLSTLYSTRPEPRQGRMF